MASDKEKLARANARLKRIKKALEEVRPKREKRKREDKQKQVKNIDERHEKILGHQIETRKDLTKLEKELEELHKENDDDDAILGDGSDAELDLEKEIQELEKELRERLKRINKLERKEDRLRDRFKELQKETEQAQDRQSRLKKRRANTQKLIKDLKKATAPSTSSGTGPWGGSMSVVEQEVVPIMVKHGPITSRKRVESYGNPTSDHHVSQGTAYAADCGTANNYRLGQEIRSKLASGTHKDYENFYFTRSGKQFRGQTICGTHGTGPHTHNGVRS